MRADGSDGVIRISPFFLQANSRPPSDQISSFNMNLTKAMRQ